MNSDKYLFLTCDNFRAGEYWNWHIKIKKYENSLEIAEDNVSPFIRANSSLNETWIEILAKDFTTCDDTSRYAYPRTPKCPEPQCTDWIVSNCTKNRIDEDNEINELWYERTCFYPKCLDYDPETDTYYDIENETYHENYGILNQNRTVRDNYSEEVEACSQSDCPEGTMFLNYSCV